MLPPLVQWQKLDENGFCYPWFTHAFLEVLDSWDLKEKSIMEWGGGHSTIWWASRGAYITCVETSQEWSKMIEQAALNCGLEKSIHVKHFPVNEGDPEPLRRNAYLDSYHWNGYKLNGPDICVVDGVLRFECMQKGIELLSVKGGKLIVDNYQQDGFICPACAELVATYEGHIYRQEDHTDHHGNPWQTAYFEIPAK